MRLCVVALLTVLLPFSANATVLVPAEFTEVVNGSDVIVYGRVTATDVQWSGDRRNVETLVTIQAGTYLKGVATDSLVVKVPGGTIGRYMNVLVGAPRFTVGDEAVFFLKANGREHPTVFGLNQGIYRVRVDPATRRRIVSPPVVDRDGGRTRVVRGEPSRRPLALESFGAHVQAVLGGRSVGDR